jgi:hypothetical protein
MGWDSTKLEEGRKKQGTRVQNKRKIVRERKFEKWKVGVTNMNEAKH